jgi:hypothetical protein
MKANKFFTDRQFGFISGRSTSLQLLNVLDRWTEAIDQGKSIDVIYMDYMKAFDSPAQEAKLTISEKFVCFHVFNNVLPH